MLLLTETAAGYGLFQVKNKKLLKMEKDEIYKSFNEGDDNVEMLSFMQFKDTKMAMEESTALVESKMGKQLKKFLKKNVVDAGLKEELAVIDKALGSCIKEKLGISIEVGEQVRELQRALRMNIATLVEDIAQKDSDTMSLSLAHTMARFKLKFSPDKVDTMIVQAIGLMDDLDKELNNYAMRLKEWYGWHFPELAKILTDGLVYAKCVKAMGMRNNAKNVDFSQFGVPEEVEAEVKRAAETSYGTDITEEDLGNIQVLTERVIQLMTYRAELAEYLKLRMGAIAPNLTHMVGELIGARLISHAGSLMNLSKHPASTVQVLGAEKALFRAMKTKTNTPKYGLLYHANLVGKAHSKFKGKISRVLAAKLALSIRVDALGDDSEPTVARAFRDYVERRVATCEDGDDIAASRKHLKKANNASAPAAAATSTNAYNQEADAVTKKRSAPEGGHDGEGEPEKKKKKKKSKDAKPSE